jgi:hypothetical protein
MTKKDLKQKMLDFISLQSDNDKDDWYTTSQNAAQCILMEFAEHLNIDLTVRSIQIEKE